MQTSMAYSFPSINRIRLEFKADYGIFVRTLRQRINRIRLEFKVNGKSSKQKKAEKVLIESDWNLKLTITA